MYNLSLLKCSIHFVSNRNHYIFNTINFDLQWILTHQIKHWNKKSILETCFRLWVYNILTSYKTISKWRMVLKICKNMCFLETRIREGYFMADCGIEWNFFKAFYIMFFTAEWKHCNCCDAMRQQIAPADKGKAQLKEYSREHHSFRFYLKFYSYIAT